ncbi:23S rRNA (uracil(1939)-C(5))-methyltransferase RlmD [Alteromonas sp. C1M14]|uniref:23S rRNA (uracil(1939)-C(5))-methyltransferase RlmD n=1 Tax=Alteromonas sp. C1M14 TaxID=2841567 RepID=UPI001C0A2F48|nr:23S rRNA (uracil(1939)-C(5))-methyltransferase RlmD [Alteromonas sp. C1M14]MBU2977666.1 23S rRNA (uracil(1939)-C(5))-methyltransferase RlmD [Alteromonas sp. C1M14]
MVSFYKPSTGKKAQTPRRTVTVDTWDMLGQGVCTQAQPVLFVEGALPGETVEVNVHKQQKRVAYGSVHRVIEKSDARRSPFCPVAKQCGGCQLQHVEAHQALSLRQQALTDYWHKQLGIAALPWAPPIVGNAQGYRRKARFAIDARNKNGLKLGYRQINGKDVMDIDACPILEPALSSLIVPLKTLLSAHGDQKNIGHVSVMAGDEVTAITLRMTKPATAAFEQALIQFAKDHQSNVQLQLSGGIKILHEAGPLTCETEPGLVIRPGPDDFIQVNKQVNQRMIQQAMAWLNPQPEEKIADWFSGLGNFSLSLAQRGAEVFAAEGVAQMVHRANENALLQSIDGIHWSHLDLSCADTSEDALQEGFHKILLDPSRDGAQVVCEALARHRVDTILYVSCNPSTLTRDARCLLASGYSIEKVGLVEMFPQTRHLEVMMLFTDKNNA